MKPIHLDMLSVAETLSPNLEEGKKPDLSKVNSLLQLSRFTFRNYFAAIIIKT